MFIGVGITKDRRCLYHTVVVTYAFKYKKEGPGHCYNMLETNPDACFETALVGQGFDIFKKIHFP